MNRARRQSALRTLQWHYQGATSKAAKTQLLNHAAQVLGLERNYLIKCLRQPHPPATLTRTAARRRGGSAKKYLPTDLGIIKAQIETQLASLWQAVHAAQVS